MLPYTCKDVFLFSGTRWHLHLQLIYYGRENNTIYNILFQLTYTMNLVDFPLTSHYLNVILLHVPTWRHRSRGSSVLKLPSLIGAVNTFNKLCFPHISPCMCHPNKAQSISKNVKIHYFTILVTIIPYDTQYTVGRLLYSSKIFQITNLRKFLEFLCFCFEFVYTRITYTYFLTILNYIYLLNFHIFWWSL